MAQHCLCLFVCVRCVTVFLFIFRTKISLIIQFAEHSYHDFLPWITCQLVLVCVCVCDVWTLDLPVLAADNPKGKRLSLITTKLVLMGLRCCSYLSKMLWWIISFGENSTEEFMVKSVFAWNQYQNGRFAVVLKSLSHTSAVWRSWAGK